jgi:hypothetical protein
VDYLEDKERRGVQQEGNYLADHAHLQDANVGEVLAPLAQAEAEEQGG